MFCIRGSIHALTYVIFCGIKCCERFVRCQKGWGQDCGQVCVETGVFILFLDAWGDFQQGSALWCRSKGDQAAFLVAGKNNKGRGAPGIRGPNCRKKRKTVAFSRKKKSASKRQNTNERLLPPPKRSKLMHRAHWGCVPTYRFLRTPIDPPSFHATQISDACNPCICEDLAWCTF